MAPRALANSLPALKTAYDKLADTALVVGITFGMADFGGTRTEADTVVILGYRKADYAVEQPKRADGSPVPIEEWRPIAPYGESFHNYGAAFDIDPDKIGASDGRSRDDALAELGMIAEGVCGLRWGGNFPADRLDPRHFELAIPLSEAKAEWDSQTRSPLGFASLAALAVVAALAVIIVLIRRFMP